MNGLNMRERMLGATALARPIERKEEAPGAHTDAEVVRLWGELKNMLKAEREKNDANLAEIKRGMGDVVRGEELKTLADKIAESERKLEQALLALKRPAFGSDGVAGTAEQQKAVLQWFATKTALQNRSLAEVPLEVSADELKAHADYRKVWAKFIRLGNDVDRMSDGERKTLAIGQDPTGGWLVPAEMSSTVIKRLFDTSPVRSIANVITIGSQAYEYPLDTNDAATGGWVGEMTPARTATGTPNLGMGRIPVYEQYAMPDTSQQMLEDAILDIETWLLDKVTGKFTRVENVAFVTGNGSQKPRGFMDYAAAADTAEDSGRAWGKLQYLVSGAGAGFMTGGAGADAFIELITKCKADFLGNGRFTFNRFTQAAIRKIKDGQGNYLWSMGSIPQGIPNSLLGFPITILEDMDNVGANKFPVAFGDFRQGYQIVDRLGISTLRDPYSAKPKVQFYMRKRVGGDVVNFDAIKLMKIST